MWPENVQKVENEMFYLYSSNSKITRILVHTKCRALNIFFHTNTLEPCLHFLHYCYHLNCQLFLVFFPCNSDWYHDPNNNKGLCTDVHVTCKDKLGFTHWLPISGRYVVLWIGTTFLSSWGSWDKSSLV